MDKSRQRKINLKYKTPVRFSRGVSRDSRNVKVPTIPVEEERRRLDYFGHKDDGNCTLKIRSFKIPCFQYKYEHPIIQGNKYPAEEAKPTIFEKLRVTTDFKLDRFLVAPDRKNVWMGGIRSQCEGVLTAKSYKFSKEDRGAYSVIPEVEGSTEVTVEAVYKMWLALECAMIRRDSLIIVEDPALADVTKRRTEQWRLMNRLVNWGSTVCLIFAIFAPRHPTLYMLPFCMAYYGEGMMRAMNQRDPASRYSECCINRQYELDPDSHTVCDAQVSLKYLRCPRYRMFKLENYKRRNKGNLSLIGTAMSAAVIALIRKVYNFDYFHHMIRRGFEVPFSPNPKPLNIFEQVRKRFFTFGNAPEPGRTDLIHWLVQNGLLYYFLLRHIPSIIQTALEYFEREYVMETSIRLLQFRNLAGEERYEFPARNLYRTMQKDFPHNRILKEIREHYEPPPAGYYESEEFLSTREPLKITLGEAVRRWKVAYYRNW